MRAGCSGDSEDDEDVVPTTSTSDALTSTNSEASVGRSVCSKAQKRKLYKARLSYKKEWEQKYSWVYCDDPKQGMFYKLCQKRGNAPSTARGAWTTWGIQDWNHATEQLEEHTLLKMPICVVELVPRYGAHQNPEQHRIWHCLTEPCSFFLVFNRTLFLLPCV